MNVSVVSIFPQMIEHFLKFGLIERAIKNQLLKVGIYDLRDYSNNKHRKIDDRPFGGGAGMVMMPEPLFNSVESIKKKKPGRVILFSAYAEILTQDRVKELSRQEHLILVCGRYEGVDQRFIDVCVDEEISIGPYVLMGGELAAEVLIESISRMIDGVIGNPDSVERDSYFLKDQYGIPQYTQPRSFRGLDVPEVLLSGNHRDIDEWRKQNQKGRQK